VKNPFLENNHRVRFATVMLLYFAQGIPRGLLQVAMPAWLASQGLSAAAIASYLAVVILPWVFKLFTGPVMDRFQYPTMGLRRPWVLGAQLGMSLSLCLLTAVTDPLAQFGLLTAIAVIVNIFTATQDVAVDGMAIDLVPENEQGRINAFMTFGKAVGWTSAAALSGGLLGTRGLGAAGLVAAAVSLALFVGFLFVREREGERLLPWTAGRAMAGDKAAPTVSSVVHNLNAVLWKPASLFVFAILFWFGLGAGYADALMPIAAVNAFHYSTEQWSELVASVGLLAAFGALGIGPIIDRFDVKRISILVLAVMTAHALAFSLTSALWENTVYVRAMLSLWVLVDPVGGVAVTVIAMSICSRTISATQFAVYMAAANLGASSGSTLYALISETTHFAQGYLGLALVLATNLCILIAFRRQDRFRPAAGL